MDICIAMWLCSIDSYNAINHFRCGFSVAEH